MLHTLSKRIVELRRQTGLTQAELARRLHLSRSSVNSWESASSYPSIDSLISLSQLFHVTTDYLLGLSPSKAVFLDKYSPREQELVFRILQYFDENKNAPLPGVTFKTGDRL